MNVLEFDILPEDYAKQLGLIVLQSDVTIEDEFRFYLDDVNASLLVSRIPFENSVTVESLKQMQGHLSDSMSLFPINVEFDCLGYACTSGALHIGTETITDIVSAVRPCAATSNPMHAAIAAMNHMGIGKIAYLAPYSQLVSQTMIDHFEANDIQVADAATFDEAQDKIVGLISPESIKKAATNLLGNSAAEAVFIACTNMKCAQVIPAIEESTGVVALSSNQVLAWHMAALSNIPMSKENKGKLFTY